MTELPNYVNMTVREIWLDSDKFSPTPIITKTTKMREC